MALAQLGDILLREVHPSRQMGLQGRQRVLLCRDLPGQRTVQGGIRQCCPLSAIGRDEVHDRLCLRQAELAVQEGAAGVLAGGGRRRARRDAGFHQPPGHRTSAVAGKLHHILAGVAVGCAEKQRHPLIKSVLPFHECAEHGRIALGLRHLLRRVGRAEHPLRHLIAFRAGQPHDGDAACARGRCDGRNGRMLHLLPSLFADEYSIFYHEPPKKEICCAKKRHTAGESGSVPLLHFILGSSRQGDSALPLPDTSVFRPI